MGREVVLVSQTKDTTGNKSWVIQARPYETPRPSPVTANTARDVLYLIAVLLGVDITRDEMKRIGR